MAKAKVRTLKEMPTWSDPKQETAVMEDYEDLVSSYEKLQALYKEQVAKNHLLTAHNTELRDHLNEVYDDLEESRRRADGFRAQVTMFLDNNRETLQQFKAQEKEINALRDQAQNLEDLTRYKEQMSKQKRRNICRS